MNSPECKITPWGVWNVMAIDSGTEWVTGMNSTPTPPICTVSPSLTAMKRVRSANPAFSTRCRASPTVSSEP